MNIPACYPHKIEMNDHAKSENRSSTVFSCNNYVLLLFSFTKIKDTLMVVFHRLQQYDLLSLTYIQVAKTHN